MLVHRMIVGAAAGGLVGLTALVLVLHPAGSQRLVVAAFLQVAITAGVMGLVMRPRPKQPLTWAAAMAGAIAVTGLCILALGSVPHEWITFADAQLGWGRRDLLVIDTPIFDISRQAIRDMIEAGLYMNSFAAIIALFLLWQRRHELAEERETARAAAAEEQERVPAGTSAYGRPVAR